jgi:hypothetical protein
MDYMLSLRVFARFLALAGALSALVAASTGTARANVTVNGMVTFNSTLALYTYSYSVTNNLADPLALVNIAVLPDPTAVLNPMAPTGFLTIFDPGPFDGVGLVSFLEDADPETPQSFAPGTTVSGFSFQSRFGPNPTPYTHVNANSGVEVVGGTTVGPAAVIPEPGTLLLGLSAAPGLLLLPLRRRCRRRRAAAA